MPTGTQYDIGVIEKEGRSQLLHAVHHTPGGDDLTLCTGDPIDYIYPGMFDPDNPRSCRQCIDEMQHH